MKKISNDDTFENYVGKFIDMNINGTVHKFYVSNIDSGSITTNAGILYPDTFNIIRESPEQDCQICADVCYQNVPVLKLIFTNYVDNRSVPEYYGGPVSNFVNNYIDDTFDLYLNGTLLGRINTRDYKSPAPTEEDINGPKRNEIWFIPNYNNDIEVTYAYASASNRSSYYSFFHGEINSLGLSSYNANLFDKNYFNEIALVPVSCNNPTVCTMDYCPYGSAISNIFLTYPSIVLDIHKVVVKTNGTSALSCVSYNMHQFDAIEGGGHFNNDNVYLRSFNPFVEIGTPYATELTYFKEGLSAGSLYQAFSASFYYLDPCTFSSPPFYTLDQNYYYNYNDDNNTADIQFAYALPENVQGSLPEQPINNPFPPVLRKHIFFNSPSLSDTRTLYLGENRKAAPYSAQYFSTTVDNPGVFQTRGPFFPFTPAYAGVPPYPFDLEGTNGLAVYSDMFANDLFEGDFYCLENRTNIGGSVNFRRINVYLETTGETTVQHLSVSNIVSL